jgi:hypothetical protein
MPESNHSHKRNMPFPSNAECTAFIGIQVPSACTDLFLKKLIADYCEVKKNRVTREIYVEVICV